MFNQSVIEQLKYYVYFLKDPRTKEVFYVGKGVGNRIFQHVDCALESESESDKLNKIREIKKYDMDVEHYILRHGLTESAAFEIEAALIDFVGVQNLTNLQSGHYSNDYGIKTTDEIVAMYTAPPFISEHPVLLININKLYKREMTKDEIYEATRHAWVLGPRKDKTVYAIATYRGLTREVYKINSWYKTDNGRWGFVGEVAEKEICDNYRYKSIAHLIKRGAANPVKYINC